MRGRNVVGRGAGCSEGGSDGGLHPSPAELGFDSTGARQAIDACLARLNRDGYRQHLDYQPANRFWTLRWAETGLFLGVSGLRAWFCFWWVRRRLT